MSGQQLVVSAIGGELVVGRGHQVRFASGCQLAEVGHPNGWVGFRAQAAEDALAQVQRYGPGAAAVAARERTGGASGDGRPRVLPVGEIYLRSPPRLQFGAVEFGGRMWVLGGYSYGYRHDVWFSTDGVNWANATGIASWGVRSGSGVVALNGQMWVLGGYGGGWLNDVWSSSDGVYWTCATPGAPWGQRYEFGAAVFNGQMWALGGASGSGMFNDVWSSSDGANWTCATNAAPWPARFSPRALAFNGKLWVMGGSVPGETLLNDVWSSDDGTNWTCVTHAAPWNGRRQFGAVALNGRMWVMGGTDAAHYFNDVWSSNDGATWTQVTNSAAWNVRYDFGAMAFNGQIWVMGGSVGSGNVNDVWFSENTALPALTNIVVTPANPVIVAGSNQQFTATGFYDDGSSRVLTNGSPGGSCAWLNSSPTVASIDTNGAATGLTNGVTLITATSGSISGSAILTVVTTPAISANPVSTTVSPGGNATLSVTASGGVLSYQWALNGTNLAGATDCSLVITNFSPANVGSYTVTVSNLAGSVTSLAVTLASVDIKMFAGVVVNGPLGSNYLIQATSSLVTNWMTLTNIALPAQPYIYIDYNSPTNRQQFYRAVPGQ